MANAEVMASARAEWAPANPWPWMLTGLAATGSAWLWDQVFADAGTPVRFLLIALGLLAAGVAVWLRLGSSRPAFVEGLAPERRRLALLALAGVGALLALAVTVLVLAEFAGVPDLLWPRGSIFLMWFLVAPWSAWLAQAFLRRSWTASNVSAGLEAAALLTLAAVAAFAARWALYLGRDRAAEWDSFQLFLAMLALVALVASPLMAVSRSVRRIVLSLLVVVHFVGILTAVMSAPPSPWLAAQLWMRIYRPYLEFMYLNNAYHFYAPEPGPASYLWCRVESEDRRTKKKHSEWFKIPDMDDNTGKPRYRVALEYQRMMAMVENTARNDPSPSIYVRGPDGLPHFAAYYDQRVKHSPLADSGAAMVGAAQLEPGLQIPFHPEVALLNQYQLPNLSSRLFLSSFARFIMHKAAAKEPQLKPLRVKVYRAVHIIPPPGVIAEGADPCLPTLYYPFYMGEFDAEGNMTREAREDPFLYWLLPILGDGANTVTFHVFRHAGEPVWKLDIEQTMLQTKMKLPEAR